MTTVLNWLVSQSFLSAVLFKTTLAFAIACLAHAALRKASPRWRVLLWRGVFFAIVALPFVTRMTPPLNVEVTNTAPQPPNHASVAESSSQKLHTVKSEETIQQFPSVETQHTTFLKSVAQHRRGLLIGLWSIVSLALFATSLRDALRLRRALHTAAPAPAAIADHAHEMAADLRLSRQFTLLTMRELGSPFVTGILRSILVLPQRIVEHNDAVQLRAVLAHELAHIKSMDVLWMAVARTVACLLWFHPLAWLARALHRAACEEVCDGVAAAQIDNSDAYAQVLASEALALLNLRSLPGAVPMVRSAEILRRIRRIHGGIRVNPLARRSIAAAFVVALVSLLGLASIRFVHAQQAPSLDDYPNVIEIETYQPNWAHFQPGDSIEILEVRGTEPDFQKGHRYYVRGRYVLASHKSAELHVYATNGEVRSDQGPAVAKGAGEFVRTFTLLQTGDPHVSFYPVDGGDGFGGTYFKRAGSLNWRSAFNQVYFLNDNQVLKRVAPPFIPERMNYYFADSPGQAAAIPSGPTYMTFHWDGNIKNWGMGFSDAPYSIEGIITNALEVSRGQFEGPASVLDAPLPGDWIIRIPSSAEDRMRAFTDILRNELKMKVRLDRQHPIRPVVVVTGNYHFTPLPNTPRNPDAVHLFSDELDSEEGAGGGTGTLNELFGLLSNFIEMRFVNEAAPSTTEVEWTNHRSAQLKYESTAETRRPMLDQLLNNLHNQTGLNFSVQDRAIDMWVLSEVQ